MKSLKAVIGILVCLAIVNCEAQQKESVGHGGSGGSQGSCGSGGTCGSSGSGGVNPASSSGGASGVGGTAS